MSLFPASLIQATDNDGNPVAGAKWELYLTATSTPTNAYSNSILTTSLGSTVTADSSGWFVPIYFDDSVTYRAVLKTSAGAVIGGKDIDPVNTTNSIRASFYANIATTLMASGDIVETSGYTVAGTGAARYIADATASAALAAAHPRFCRLTGTAGVYARILPTDGGITPEQAGVIPASETNAGQFMTDICKYLRAVYGGGVLRLSPATTYSVTALAEQTVGGTYTHPTGGCVFIPPTIDVQCNGATIKAVAAGTDLFKVRGEVLFTGIVTGAMAAGASVYQLATVGDAVNYAVGDYVLFRLGDIFYDLPETENWGFTRVTGVNTGTGQITVARPLSRAWDGTGTNNKHLYKMLPYRSQFRGQLNFEPVSESVGVQAGLVILNGLSPRVDKVLGKGCYAGAFIAQYVEDFHVGTVEARDNPYLAANQGQGARLAEATGRIDTLITYNMGKDGVSAEAGSVLTVGYHNDINCAAATRNCISGNGSSRVTIENGLYEGKGNHQAFNAINGATVDFGSLRCVTDVDVYVLPMPGFNVRRLSLRVANVEELYNAARGRWWEGIVFLGDNMNLTIPGYSGCVAQAFCTFGGGLLAADVSSFYFGRTGGATDLKALATNTQLEKSVMSPYGGGGGFGGISGNQGWTLRAQQSALSIQTPVGPALAGSGKYARWRMLIIPNELAAALDTTPTLDIAREFQSFVYEGSKTYDAPSIATLASTTTTVTVTGAAVGDFVDSVSFGLSLAGLQVTGEVTAANTITLTLQNPTAAAIDLASTTVRVRVGKPRLGA